MASSPTLWPKRTGLQMGFRSGLEAKNSEHLKAHRQPVNFETFRLPYLIPQTKHHYTVDFRLANGILVETKGRWLAVDRAKHLYVRAQYPDLDIRLVFSNPRSPIAQGSKTTVSAWATNHGMVWASRLIPLEWMEEVGPPVTPEEVMEMGPWGYAKWKHDNNERT